MLPRNGTVGFCGYGGIFVNTMITMSKKSFCYPALFVITSKAFFPLRWAFDHGNRET